MTKKELTIEETYQKKNPIEHILLLPDTYIGSVECGTDEVWIYDNETKKIISKEIVYPPGLYKITDEIYVNARDHTVRPNTNCKNIYVSIDQHNGVISVWNDGTGIPVVIHKEYGIYVPELIFGNLLSGSNFDKEEKKIVGGKNGYGAKLANIFSTEFILETIDSKNNKKYVQRFENNMGVINPPEISNVPANTNSYTKITYKPDLKRFGLVKLSDDFTLLLTKRVYDLAACTSNDVNVYLNDEHIKIKTFEEYITMYYNKKINMIYREFNERWKVGIIFDPTCGFKQISFVNGICTYKGGKHVNYIIDQITRELAKIIKDKNKDLVIKPSYIKENITIFLDSIIENPNFSSQSKEELTNKPETFGSHCIITSDFIKELAQTGIIELIIKTASLKNDSELSKTDYKKTINVKDIPKLDDAHLAGTKRAAECQLILTEGDSAKALVTSAIDMIGRDKFGVFPLRGKFLNTREASNMQLLKNEEFKNIKLILGLKQKKIYSTVKGLRYGGIIILTDQDADGSHIKGLIINMFATFWPSLLKINGFIQFMKTPIIKAFKTKGKDEPKSFYTITAYKNWVKSDLNDDTTGYKIKYYKGLGTSDKKEAKILFSDFEKKLVKCIWEISEGEKKQEENKIKKQKNDDDDDSATDGESVNIDDEINDQNSESYKAFCLCFEKERANDRKKWLFHYDKEDIVDANNAELTYSDFIHKEVKHFSAYSNHRAIPSGMDGLKPSHRKIIFGAFEKNIIHHEMKVAQFGAYVAERTLYHHGEASLFKTIVGLSQDFVGSNNINLLLPNGQYGDRNGNGAASPRYIFTQLNKLTPLIFRKEDNCVYDYVDEDGTLVEPTTYAPIIPFALINGAEGIGTGFSTLIPSYNPLDLCDCIFKLMENQQLPDIIPWYKGFKGKIVQSQSHKYQCTGIYKIIDEKTIQITELPIGVWTDTYREEVLNALKSDGKTIDPKKILEDHKNNSGSNHVDITVTLCGGKLPALLKSANAGIDKTLKLHNNINTSNMWLFNSKGNITKYDNVKDIITEYYQYRLEMYTKRKEAILKILENKLKIIESKVRFITLNIEEKLVLKDRDEVDVIKDLRKLNFEEFSYDINSDKPSYRYLTDMKIWSVTKTKKLELIKERDDIKKEHDLYAKLTIKEIWTNELNEFIEEYKAWQEKTNDEENGTDTNKTKTKKTRTKKVKNEEVIIDTNIDTKKLSDKKVDKSIDKIIVKGKKGKKTETNA